LIWKAFNNTIILIHRHNSTETNISCETFYIVNTAIIKFLKGLLR